MIKSNRLLALLFATSVACLVTPQLGLAQDYPNKSIKLIIPYPPGGGTDYVGRVVGSKMAELTKWSVILENRPGAGGNLAAEAVAKMKSPVDLWPAQNLTWALLRRHRASWHEAAEAGDASASRRQHALLALAHALRVSTR